MAAFTPSRIGSLRRITLLAVAAVAVLAVSPLAPGAQAAPKAKKRTWAAAAQAPIHPGVQTESASGQCTANFVFTNGADVLIGQAAHCTGTGAATETDGCLAKSRPLGTQVNVQGASKPGVLVYNSWLTMQARGERDDETCAYNDFALVKLDPADHAKVNPSIPYWGGPVGMATSTDAFEKVYSYGNSGLRLGIQTLSPKEGYSLGPTPDGWSHLVYTATPGIPGDSGSAFLDSTGKGVGILSTLGILPYPAGNEVTDLSRALAYAKTHGTGFTQLALVPGTEPFEGGILP